jgi:hypothetical protein
MCRFTAEILKAKTVPFLLTFVFQPLIMAIPV